MLPFGKEKQTDNDHLAPLDPAFEKIESILFSLSAQQLEQVNTFLLKNVTNLTNASPVLNVKTAQIAEQDVETAKTENQSPKITPSSHLSSMPLMSQQTTEAPSQVGTA